MARGAPRPIPVQLVSLILHGDNSFPITAPLCFIFLAKRSLLPRCPPFNLFSAFGDREKLAGIVNDLTNDSPQVTMALGIVEVAKLGGGFVESRVGRYKSMSSAFKFLCLIE